MTDAPTAIVFDVNETLSDMAPMADRFTDVGAPPHLARTWFASLLRDGFALAAAGSSERFAVLGEGMLRTVFAGVDLDRGTDDAVEHVMSGFTGLDVHPDVPDGVRRLRAAGIRLVTLTNGSTGVSEQLLGRAGIRDELEMLLSVEDAGVWKPAAGAYAYACRTLDVAPGEAMLVAVHPWDTDGADRAGLRTAYVDRGGAGYPSYFTAPELTVSGLGDLADRLGA